MTRIIMMMIVSFVLSLGLVACKKGPAVMTFSNVKGKPYINFYMHEKLQKQVNKGEKKYEDVFSLIRDTTTVPGIIMSCHLPSKLGASRVVFQLIDNVSGSVDYKWEGDTNPDMMDLSLFYNLKSRGSYTTNFVVKDEIICQGKIKYE
jgi:hypothetical protein